MALLTGLPFLIQKKNSNKWHNVVFEILNKGSMKKICLLLLISILGLNAPGIAQNNLLITPKRVVFEGNKQKAELNLMNTGSDTATYSISFRHYNMTEQGRLELVENLDTAKMVADPYLRIFPRQVTLAPQEAQVIMLQCRRNTDMIAGEYRTHLWFRSEKNYEPLKIEKPVLDSNQMSVTLMAIFGITIPVIIRSGELIINITLSDLALENRKDTVPSLKFTIHRTGNISAYGNIKVEFVPEQGKPFEIGALKSVGVYTNITKRHITIPLNKKPGVILKNGKVRVSYSSPDDVKKICYAQEVIEVM